MKRAAIAAMALAIGAMCAPAQAAPRWLTAAPRLAGRTVANMATFRDKREAAQDWAVALSVLADGATSHRVLVRNPNAWEASPLMPRRPGAGQYWLEMTPLALGECMLTKWDDELVRDDANRVIRNIGGWPAAGILVARHTISTADNVKNGGGF